MMDDLLGPIIYWSSWYYISSRLYCLYSIISSPPLCE